MDDQNKNPGVFLSSSGSSPSVVSLDLNNDPPLAQPPPEGQIPLAGGFADRAVVADDPKRNVLVRLAKRADVVLAVLLVLGSIGLVITARDDGKQAANTVAEQYSTVEIPLAEFSTEAGIDFGEQSVTINGDLVLSPSVQPASGTAGQIYYDQTSNVLAYYNGTQFIPLTGATTATTTTTTNVPIQTVGAGLTLAGTQVSNAGVLSLQGQTGAVTLAAGNGIAVTGTTISNSGVVSLASGNPTLVITDDGNGNNVLTVNLSGSGVTSLNGLSGVLNIANATAAGSTVTINDASTAIKGIATFNSTNFSVGSGAVNTIQNINTAASPTFAGVNTNTITPSSTLTVGATGQQLILQGNSSTQLTATGGGFTTALGFAGVPTGAVTYTLDRSVTPGTYALCSTVGNCAGTGSGVTSIVGGTGNRLAKFTAAQNIENSTITDDGTNVTTTVDLVIQGGEVTVGVANAQTGTINFAHSGSAFLGSVVQGALTGNRSYLLPDANGTFCLTSGNCSGSGSSNTLQAAYDAGNTITTLDNRNIILTFADTATDSNMLINLECDTACAGNGRFAVQDDGVDIVSVAPSAIVLGSATTNVPITISSGTGAINIGNGAEGRTVNVGTGTAAQTVTLGSTDTTSTTLIQSGSGNITLNSGGTIALQDSTTVAGNLTITGTATDTLTVKSPGNGSGAVVLNLQQSDNDSVLRVTDTGTLTVGNSTNVAGSLAIGNGAGADLVEIKVDNITASTILQLPNVATGSTFCTDAGNCGTTTGTLQNAYSYSTGGTTPEIKLDTTRNGIEIQDANSTIGSGQNFLSLRGPNAGGLGSILVSFGTEGNLFMQPSANRTDLVDINTNGGANLLTVDSVNSRVGIALGGSTLPSFTLDVGGTLNTSGAATLGSTLAVATLGTANTATYLCRNGTNQIAACSTTGTAVAFVQDGNSFGATAVLGTNDSNSLTFETNNTTQATVAVGGATTFQNSVNSTSAFRVLSVGSGELVGVDSVDSMLRLLGNNTGHLSGTGSNWSTATSLPSGRFGGAAVALNGYLYQIGGCDSGGGTDDVYYAQIKSDGSLGAWSTMASLLPANLCGNSATTYNGYIYVHGGTGSAAGSQDIYYAKPNGDGTISGWTAQNDPTGMVDHVDGSIAAYSGFLYATGGRSDDGNSTRRRGLYYGKINADGSVPTFSVQANWLPDSDFNPGQMLIANGTMFAMGTSNYDKFYYGTLNEQTGAPISSSANQTNGGAAVTDARRNASIAVLNGYLYAIAGGSNGTTTFQYGALSSTGDLPVFSASAAADSITLPAARDVCSKVAPTYNNYIYMLGCSDGTFSPTTDVYYAGGARVKVGGALDLVGYSGEGMSEGQSGGQLSAGNTFINGALSVTGNTILKDGAAVAGALNVTGTASIQTTTNTTTGFQVLNATAIPQFVIDTTNARTYVGNPVADSTGALLFLDVKNTPGDPDPSGTNGAMYYNSSVGRFRCFEGDIWGECLGVPRPNTRRVTYFAASGDTEMTGYGDILASTGNNGSGAGSSSPPEVSYQTTSVSGDSAGLEGETIYGVGGSAYEVFQTEAFPFSSTSERVWIGFTSELRGTMAASATPTGSYAAFRFDTSAGDTTWKCITRDGVSATVTDSGITPSSVTGTMEIVIDHDVRAIFKIDDTPVCDVTATLPGPDSLRVISSITTLSAAIRTLFVGWIYVESGYDGY